MSTRKVVLLTIGAPPLPVVTPVVPVPTTTEVDSYTAPDLAPPSLLTVTPIIDGVLASWTASTEAGVRYIVETAPDASGVPGSWTIYGSAGPDLQYQLALPDGPRWVRVYAALHGRASAPLAPVLAEPKAIPGGAYNANLLVNAGLTVSTAGWSQYSNTTGVAWHGERDGRTVADRIAGTHTLAVHSLASPADGEVVWVSEPVSAWPGEMYLASGWIARDDAQAFVGVMFFGEGGGLLDSAYSGEAGATGGTDPANWARLMAAKAAPALSRTARFAFVVSAIGGGSEPAGFLLQPMLEHAKPDQTGPSDWHMGGAEGFAEHVIKVGVGGRIAALALRSDGTESAIDFDADAFRVTDPDGNDSLQWADGVISADKAARSVKIGPGFGSDAAGQRLIFYYGPGGSAATRSRAGARVFIAEDGGVKLGSVQVNFGSAWKSGAAITYTATAGTPATATISVTAGVFAVGSDDYTYAASSANVSGDGGTSVAYYLYYHDPARLGGARTLYASTDPAVHYTHHDYVIVGQVTVAFPTTGTGTGGGGGPGGGDGGGGGGGGGGSYCPSVDARVIAQRGTIRAGEVRAGDHLLLCDPDTGIEAWGEVTYSAHKRCAGVRLHAEGATLTCSRTAPIPTDGGYRDACDVQGHRVPIRRRGRHSAPIVERVESAGMIDVQHIFVGDRCFWVGDDGESFFLHHNIKFWTLEP